MEPHGKNARRGLVTMQTLGFAAVIFVVFGVVMAVGGDILRDLRAENPCESGFTYIENATFPDGRCCDADTTDECGTAHNGTHGFASYSVVGNTTITSQQSLTNLSSRSGLLATVVILGAIVTLLFLVMRGYLIEGV